MTERFDLTLITLNTSELIGRALDYATLNAAHQLNSPGVEFDLLANVRGVCAGRLSPSTDWEQGGALLEQFRASVLTSPSGRIYGRIGHLEEWQAGATLLEAGMRAIVFNQFGPAVRVPAGLVQNPHL